MSTIRDTADTAQPEMANALVPVPFDKPKRNDMMVASLVPDQRPSPQQFRPLRRPKGGHSGSGGVTPEALIEQADSRAWKCRFRFAADDRDADHDREQPVDV